MKSSQLKFVNPDFDSIDFELLPRSKRSILVGIGYAVLACAVAAAGIVCLFFLVTGGLFFALRAPFYAYHYVVKSAKVIRLIFMKVVRAASRNFQNPLVLLNDPRPPILYLRSFNNDSIEDPDRWDRRTAEELLTSVLSGIGPVLAVGSPSEDKNRATFPGATRIYLGDNWQSEIEKLMSISRLVVIESSFSEGLTWELNAARERVSPERLLISLLSSNENSYHVSRFLTVFSERFSTNIHGSPENVCFLYFDKNWTPFTLSLPPAVRTKSVRQIERWMMLILQNNGIISDPGYARELAAEQKRMEDERVRTEAANREYQEYIQSEEYRREFTVQEARKQQLREKRAADTMLFESVGKGSDPVSSLIGLGVITLAVTLIGLLIYAKSDYARVKSFSGIGNECLSSGRYDCAIENCGNVLEIDGANVTAFKCLGTAYFKKENYNEAIKNFDRAIELDSRDGDAYYTRAGSYFNLGNTDDQVMTDLSRAIELDPGNMRAIGLRGAAHFRKGDYQQALPDLTGAIGSFPKDPFFYTYRGNTYKALTQYDKALEDYKKALLLEPDDWNNYFNRGNLYFARKEFDQSIADYNVAIKKNTAAYSAYFNRALAYCNRTTNGSKRDDYLTAIEDLTVIVNSNSYSLDAYKLRSMVYERLGNFRLAKADRKSYEQLNRTSKN